MPQEPATQSKQKKKPSACKTLYEIHIYLVERQVSAADLTLEKLHLVYCFL